MASRRKKKTANAETINKIIKILLFYQILILIAIYDDKFILHV